MATHPDGGEWEWKLADMVLEKKRHGMHVPTTTVVLRRGPQEIRISFQFIEKPTGKMYISTIARGTNGSMLIKDLPREAKKLICSAYAVALLVE